MAILPPSAEKLRLMLRFLKAHFNWNSDPEQPDWFIKDGLYMMSRMLMLRFDLPLEKAGAVGVDPQPGVWRR
jgi:hypothetical protein